MLHRLLRIFGGLWFAVALTYAIYTFVVGWADPAAPTPGGAAPAGDLAINAALFAAFALHHSVFARSSLKQRLHQIVAEEHQRTLYVWFASLLFIGLFAAWRRLGGVLYIVPGPWAALCAIAQGLGVLLVVRSARIIDALELAGVRDPRPALQVAGPYLWVRHPLYLGFLLTVWLPSTMTVDRFWFAVLSTAYLVSAIPLEERTMEGRLGPAYQAYRSQVRWRLFPGLY